MVLRKNMIITIEPGIYFIDKLIDKLLTNYKDYINIDTLNTYKNYIVGGIRIEDNVLVGSITSSIL